MTCSSARAEWPIELNGKWFAMKKIASTYHHRADNSFTVLSVEVDLQKKTWTQNENDLSTSKIQSIQKTSDAQGIRKYKVNLEPGALEVEIHQPIKNGPKGMVLRHPYLGEFTQDSSLPVFEASFVQRLDDFTYDVWKSELRVLGVNVATQQVALRVSANLSPRNDEVQKAIAKCPPQKDLKTPLPYVVIQVLNLKTNEIDETFNIVFPTQNPRACTTQVVRAFRWTQAEANLKKLGFSDLNQKINTDPKNGPKGLAYSFTDETQVSAVNGAEIRIVQRRIDQGKQTLAFEDDVGSKFIAWIEAPPKTYLLEILSRRDLGTTLSAIPIPMKP
jgi:hypothetical protein